MIKNYKYEMPNCEDRECVNGIRSENKDGYIVQKICQKCQQIEKDLMVDRDYEVAVVNGRCAGYNIVDEVEMDNDDKAVPTMNDTIIT